MDKLNKRVIKLNLLPIKQSISKRKNIDSNSNKLGLVNHKHIGKPLKIDNLLHIKKKIERNKNSTNYYNTNIYPLIMQSSYDSKSASKSKEHFKIQKILNPDNTLNLLSYSNSTKKFDCNKSNKRMINNNNNNEIYNKIGEISIKNYQNYKDIYNIYDDEKEKQNLDKEDKKSVINKIGIHYHHRNRKNSEVSEKLLLELDRKSNEIKEIKEKLSEIMEKNYFLVNENTDLKRENENLKKKINKLKSYLILSRSKQDIINCNKCNEYNKPTEDESIIDNETNNKKRVYIDINKCSFTENKETKEVKIKINYESIIENLKKENQILKEEIEKMKLNNNNTNNKIQDINDNNDKDDNKNYCINDNKRIEIYDKDDNTNNNSNNDNIEYNKSIKKTKILSNSISKSNIKKVFTFKSKNSECEDTNKCNSIKSQKYTSNDDKNIALKITLDPDDI